MKHWLRQHWQKVYWAAIAALVIGAHVALLSSPDVPNDIALRLTTTNAMIWAVLIVPALFLTWRVAQIRKRRSKD
ncbi:MAG: phenylalanyl-tRNA synthetase subunit beta [Pseudomonadota bacterium]